MILARTPQGEIIEVDTLGDNTEMTTLEVSQLYAAEAASVDLLVRRALEYPSRISELEAKKVIFPEESDAIQAEIDAIERDRDSEVTQKIATQARVNLYSSYL